MNTNALRATAARIREQPDDFNRRRDEAPDHHIALEIVLANGGDEPSDPTDAPRLAATIIDAHGTRAWGLDTLLHGARWPARWLVKAGCDPKKSVWVTSTKFDGQTPVDVIPTAEQAATVLEKMADMERIEINPAG